MIVLAKLLLRISILLSATCAIAAHAQVTPSAATTPDTLAQNTAQASAAAPPGELALPLWEVGVGAAALYSAHYRGSDQSRAQSLPLPYFVYRGEKVTFDRDGFRASMFDLDRFEIDFNGAGAFPVKSNDNRARSGMRDLGGFLEFGPSLNYRAFQSVGKDVTVDLRIPLRAAVSISTSASPRFSGWLLTPRLNVDLKNLPGLAGTDVGSYVGPVFMDRRNSAYFYSIAPQYARVDRPTYEARGGFGGWQWVAGASKRIDNWWLGAFVRVDTVKGAVFEDSPLVKKPTTLYGGISIAWIFTTSSERARQ